MTLSGAVDLSKMAAPTARRRQQAAAVDACVYGNTLTRCNTQTGPCRHTDSIQNSGSRFKHTWLHTNNQEPKQPAKELFVHGAQ